MLISPDEIKTHLRLDSDYNSDTDPELVAFYDSAIEYCCNFTNLTVDELQISPSEFVLKPTIRQAVLLLIGDFFDNREAFHERGYTHNANTTVERLLHFHRKGLGV